MLYYLLQPFARDVRVFNLLNYITFRSAAAFVSALLLTFVFGPVIIRRLRAMAVHQVVRAGTPDSHAGKGTTPTMGGLIILAATFVWMVLFEHGFTMDGFSQGVREEWKALTSMVSGGPRRQ